MTTAHAATSFSTHDITTPLPQRTLVRRPPSVSSNRTSTTRRHRSHRSHSGGSSHLPQNEFPLFSHTGDVEILVSADGQEKRYMLHRLILAQCSGFFEASTSGQWSRAQESAAAQGNNDDVRGGERGVVSLVASEGGRVGSRREESSGPKLFWRYELDWGSEGQQNDEELPMLVQKPARNSIFTSEHTPRPPPVRNKPPSSTSTNPSSLFRSLTAMQSALHIPIQPAAPPTPSSDLVRDYDNLFRIFYNHAPVLDATNITEAYIQCKTLLGLADMYDALAVVGPRIEHHLLAFQSRLWKQVAKYPASYLKLAHLARSRVVFKEALVHIVGQWPLHESQLRQMQDSVLDLIDDKVADLEDAKARVEARLFRLNLTTRSGDRATPQNAYMEWQAVSLFRSWLADATSSPTTGGPALSKPPSRGQAAPLGGHVRPSAPPPPSAAGSHVASTLQPLSASAGADAPFTTPGRVFRVLFAAGQSYLPHEELKKFLRLASPETYSREVLRRFERRTEEIKGMARECVRGLVGSELELDRGGVAGAGMGYLTCTRMEERDWVVWD